MGSPDPAAKPLEAGPAYFAKRPLKYNGRQYDREQIIALAGLPNDEALVRLGYIGALNADKAKTPVTPLTCGQCGAAFRGVGALEGHGRRRHQSHEAPRPQMMPRQPGESEFDYHQREDAFKRSVIASLRQDEASEDARLEREAPLNWENTKATREADL